MCINCLNEDVFLEDFSPFLIIGSVYVFLFFPQNISAVVFFLNLMSEFVGKMQFFLTYFLTRIKVFMKVRRHACYFLLDSSGFPGKKINAG